MKNFEQGNWPSSSTFSNLNSQALLQALQQALRPSSDHQPSRLEVRGWADVRTVNERGIAFQELQAWLNALRQFAPQEVAAKIDFDRSLSDEAQGTWPLLLVIKIFLVCPMPPHIANDFAKQLKEITIINKKPIDIRGAELVIRAELAPEREQLRRALGKAMSAFEMRGVRTRQQMRASFPRVGSVVMELWDMSLPRPLVVARLQASGWEADQDRCSKLIGSLVNICDLIRTWDDATTRLTMTSPTSRPWPHSTILTMGIPTLTI